MYTPVSNEIRKLATSMMIEGTSPQEAMKALLDALKNPNELKDLIKQQQSGEGIKDAGLRGPALMAAIGLIGLMAMAPAKAEGFVDQMAKVKKNIEDTRGDRGKPASGTFKLHGKIYMIQSERDGKILQDIAKLDRSMGSEATEQGRAEMTQSLADLAGIPSK